MPSAFTACFGRDLVAHQADVFGPRADEGDAVLGDDLGEARILGKKAVARMDRFRAGDLAGRDDLRECSDSFARPAAGRCRRFHRPGAHASRRHRRSNAPRPSAMPISLQARLMRSAISPRLAIRIFSNIADQLRMTSDWPNSTGCASWMQISLIVPPRGARIGFIVFIASTIRSVSPSFTLSPTLTKGGLPGSGET